VSEPTIALAFTADYWVEELHRYLSDHGGARVRSVVFEPSIALEESYDVLVTGHRWPALTRALIDDVRAAGRAVLGVFDREEPASREHLAAVGVDVVVESDAGCEAFVRAIVATVGTRASLAYELPVLSAEPVRAGRVVVVGGAPGAGRTEVAIQLTAALARRASVALVDADDVAPALAARLALPIEPNLHSAIDAVEHGRGDVHACVSTANGLRARLVAGIPNANAWTQVRPGEVVRVIERLAEMVDVVVVDGVGAIEDLGGSARGRYATARALLGEADALVAVGDSAPHGVTRLLSWVADARTLAAQVPVSVVVNRAPDDRFRRAELYEELRASLGAVGIAFCVHDPRVVEAAWSGTLVRPGPFTRGIEPLVELVRAAAIAAVSERREAGIPPSSERGPSGPARRAESGQA
jgi:MinD-like ATPase involved in chromosome partitioning or flagellar assembly